MIKQLIKSRVLGTSLFVAILLVGVSGFSQVSAQAVTLDEAGTSISDGDYESLMIALKDLKRTTMADQSYTEAEKAVRLEYFDQIAKSLQRGQSVPNAIRTAMEPMADYVERFVAGRSLMAEVREAHQDAESALQ